MMKKGHRYRIGLGILMVLFWTGFQPLTPAARAQTGLESTVSDSTPASDPAFDCQSLGKAIQQQNSLISREMGQIKREIAMLRQDLSKPGIRDIIAGFGYIFGLAGIWLYVSSRKSGQA